jgi:hypothetical protein
VFSLGAQVSLAIDVDDGATPPTPLNAATAVLTITKPDLTTTAPTVPAPSPTGHYEVDYTTADVGRHVYRWVTTTPAGAREGVFYVRAGSPRWIASAEDVQALLNGQGDLDEIGELLQMATAWVESRIGPVANETVVEKHLGGHALALRKIPVVSVTSVVPIRTGGVAQTVADLDVDGPSGIVERKDGGCVYGPVRVTYVAGRANQCPEEAVVATAEIAAHMWRRDHGMGTDTFGGGDELPTGFGFAVPRAAAEMVKHLRNSWGV